MLRYLTTPHILNDHHITFEDIAKGTGLGLQAVKNKWNEMRDKDGTVGLKDNGIGLSATDDGHRRLNDIQKLIYADEERHAQTERLIAAQSTPKVAVNVLGDFTGNVGDNFGNQDISSRKTETPANTNATPPTSKPIFSIKTIASIVSIIVGLIAVVKFVMWILE